MRPLRHQRYSFGFVHPGAPALPLLVDANDNSFTRHDVHDIVLRIMKLLAKRGLAGRLGPATSE